MKIAFGELPVDVIACVTYGAVMEGVVIGLVAPSLLTLPLVIFVPGYLTTSALYPKRYEIGWVERTVLSVALSLTVAPLLGLALNYSPWGVTLSSVASAEVSFTIVIGALAYWRRTRIPKGERVFVNLELRLPSRRLSKRRDSILSVALVSMILIIAASVAILMPSTEDARRPTQFFLLGAFGESSDYPSNLNVSQTGRVVLGVENHEGSQTEFSLRIDLVGLRITYNSTLGHNQTLRVNRTNLSWFNFTIDNGQNWTQAYEFSIPTAGLWEIEFLLFKSNQVSTAYRHLQIYIWVA